MRGKGGAYVREHLAEVSEQDLDPRRHLAEARARIARGRHKAGTGERIKPDKASANALSGPGGGGGLHSAPHSV